MLYEKRIMVLIWICLLNFMFNVSDLCYVGSGVLQCCFGYVWNRIENRCIPCEDGYFGQNCSDPCPPPNFGQTCRSKCNCTDDQYCHHVRGCIQPHGAVGSCQKPIFKPKEDSSFTSLLWAAVVCLFIISAIFFTSYMYIKLRIKPYVDVTQAL
ncbi:multiple epidermal growth factor-like domains protein 10 [Crassostrea angulata]|uniref:multiple epidermal growth factor-like domains protein 10 n=1 Tax=Magallana angulata TaxID=2784310 RepID=UPI0022B0FFB8|nr:multiple epidermal growth factor-like domains protein 10 [Crassostrea angulata]